MQDSFFKFPSTPHLMILGNLTVRDDKVMTETERGAFLEQELVVEEKIDGANLGISFDSSGEIRLQNRGGYLEPPFAGQWLQLSQWLNPRVELLFDRLSDRYILFGEWCYALHSVFYDQLPDWFIGFDILDKETMKFLSVKERDALFNNLDIVRPPFINRGMFSIQDLTRMLGISRFSKDNPMEGLYCRSRNGKWLADRAKIVRPEFVQTIQQHWSKNTITRNQLIKHSMPG